MLGRAAFSRARHVPEGQQLGSPGRYNARVKSPDGDSSVSGDMFGGGSLVIM